MIKRILSIVLTLSLVLGYMPTVGLPVWADSGSGGGITIDVPTEKIPYEEENAFVEVLK